MYIVYIYIPYIYCGFSLYWWTQQCGLNSCDSFEFLLFCWLIWFVRSIEILWNGSPIVNVISLGHLIILVFCLRLLVDELNYRHEQDVCPLSQLYDDSINAWIEYPFEHWQQPFLMFWPNLWHHQHRQHENKQIVNCNSSTEAFECVALKSDRYDWEL